MPELPRCPKCGAPLPDDAPGGLCPKCLVQAGFESEVEPEPSAGGSDPAVQPTLKSPAGSGTGFEPPSPEELVPLFPQLEILELLGKGGMGAVYKARQRGLDRLVAVKILPPEIGHDAAFAERFTREARALARLSHPNIVAVYDFGRADGLFYIVMEYVDGVNLRQTIQAGGLTPQDALAIVPQICEALQFAHDEGIVHRDIKPENILIDKKGRVKIADFGLAKLLGRDAADQSLTGTHQVMGTVRYMAPEQMEGSRAVDHRADIYSLGVVFYEMLTGELPLGRFAPPSHKVQIDVRLDEVVLRSLEKEPERRYQQASHVKTDVETISRSSQPPTPVATDPPRQNSTDERNFARHAVRGPANAVLTTAILSLVSIPFVACLCWWILKSHGWGRYYLDEEFWDFLLIFQAVVVPLAAVTIVASQRMRNLELYRLSVTGAILAFLPWSPAWLFGLAAGLWALLVLRNPDVKVAFGSATPLQARGTLALEKEPERRYQQTSEVKSDVEEISRSGVAGVESASSQSSRAEPIPAGGVSSQVRRQLQGPAIALMLYGLIVLFPAALCFTNGFDIADGNDAIPAGMGFAMMALSFLLLGLAGLLLRGGWHMIALESYRAASLASFLGQPIGLWGLFVLSRPDVKSAFTVVSQFRSEPGTSPSKRPFALTLFGILNILVGTLLTVLEALDLFSPEGFRGTFPESVQGKPLFRAWMAVAPPLQYLASNVLLVAGIGLLLVKRWGRTASLGFSFFKIGMFVIELPLYMTFLIAPLVSEMNATGSEDAAATLMGWAIALPGLVCFELFFPILLLVAMQRPKVKAAFQAQTNHRWNRRGRL